MEQSTKASAINCRKPILILWGISLCFMLIGFGYHFLHGKIGDMDYIGVRFPDFFSLLSMAIVLTPLVLFAIVLFGHAKQKTLICTVFGLLAAEPLLVDHFSHLAWEDYGTIFFILGFVLALVCALRGFAEKWLLIVAIVLGLCMPFLAVFEFVYKIGIWVHIGLERIDIYSFLWLAEDIGQIFFFGALLLFGLKNTPINANTTEPTDEM